MRLYNQQGGLNPHRAAWKMNDGWVAVDETAALFTIHYTITPSYSSTVYVHCNWLKCMKWEFKRGRRVFKLPQWTGSARPSFTHPQTGGFCRYMFQKTSYYVLIFACRTEGRKKRRDLFLFSGRSWSPAVEVTREAQRVGAELPHKNILIKPQQ